MKVVILAGGNGLRLGEISKRIPKPLALIGEKPILWHVMKIFQSQGFDDFIICAGYKGEMIEDYFSRPADESEDWQVSVVDTGAETMTGGRVKRIHRLIGDNRFFLTYADGLADVDLDELLKFHEDKAALATVTAVRPTERFGVLQLTEADKVEGFQEKGIADRAWINGGFFVLEPGVFDYIEGDETVWEKEPLERLASDKQLAAYKHQGFWQCMDTPKEKQELEKLWQADNSPWRIWR